MEDGSDGASLEDGSDGAVADDVTAFNDKPSTGTLISPVAPRTLLSCGVSSAFRRHRRRLATLEGDFMLLAFLPAKNVYNLIGMWVGFYLLCNLSDLRGGRRAAVRGRAPFDDSIRWIR